MLDVGDVIDIWVVEKPLGKGGMGSVYRCHNKHAPRIMAAVKVLERGVAADARTRFVREAEVLHSLDHENIVRVRNVRLDSEPPYIEMEFVEGDTLKNQLIAGRLRMDVALEYAHQIGLAVQYLHERGIYHRDIKPSNVVVSRSGQVTLVDFGLVLDTRNDEPITSDDVRFGTVAYTPPEWCAAGAVDPEAWDVYAQAMVLFEMLTGDRGFRAPPGVPRAQRVMRIIAMKQQLEYLDPGGGMPPDVRSVVRSGTAREAHLRPKSARQWVQKVDQLIRLYGADPTDTTQIRDGELEQIREAARRISESTPSPFVSTRESRAPTQPEPNPLPHRRGGLSTPTVALLVLALQVPMFALLVFVLSTTGGAKARDVVIVPAGAPPGDVGLRLAEQLPSRIVGETRRFARVPVGSNELQWASGAGCSSLQCPGEGCPDVCETGTLTIDVPSGRGAVVLELDWANGTPVVSISP